MSAKPFSAFARYYDRFMLRYVDYPGWVDYVERIFKKFELAPKTVLDLACGTGIPTVLLAKRGYRVIGVDRSAEMLAVLAEKCTGLPIQLVRAEMTDFRLDEQVDVAISLYDSINYLLSEAELGRCFECVYRALMPSGLFAFDMNTVYSLSKFWGNRVTSRNADGIASVWENTFDDRTMVSTLHLTFWEERRALGGGTRQQRDAEDGGQPASSGEPVRFEEVHQERAYTEREVARCLRQAGFAKSWFYSHGTFFPVTPLTTRMMVVARKGNSK
ncbi:MAG: methyltransferase domain-containing protein [candidate division WOR-3 bacterium]